MASPAPEKQWVHNLIKRMGSAYSTAALKTVIDDDGADHAWEELSGFLKKTIHGAGIVSAGKLRRRAGREFLFQENITRMIEKNPWYVSAAKESGLLDFADRMSAFVVDRERTYYSRRAALFRADSSLSVTIEVRLRSIVNMLVGESQQIAEQSVATDFMFFEYVSHEDVRVRPTHKAMNRFVAAATWPGWAVIRPLNGFRCRCRLRYITKTQARQRDWLLKNGSPRFDVKWPNTMSRRNYENGIFPDPGWEGPKFMASLQENEKRT